MKKILWTICLLWVAVAAGYAQSGKLSDEKRKEFDAQKVAFFTQELELSPEEAAVFWPLYNEMQKKVREREDAIKQEFHKIRDAEHPKNEDYVTSLNKILDAEQQKCDIKKEYYRKMLDQLPAAKIWKLGDAERKFHRELFDKLRRESMPRK